MSFATAAVAGAAGASPFVLATTLTAACAHATWNSIAHGIKDKLASFTLVSLGGTICAVPLVLLSATPSSRCWGYLAISVVLHIVYTVLLMASYRLGDFSQTYPLARGTSPLVVLFLAGIVASEWPTVGQLAGVALICAGLGTLVLSGRRTGSYDQRAVLAYGLVLWAQTRGALATVAALRESSIVVAAIIGSVFFHERFGWARLAAAACVTAGIAVLYLA